MFIDMKRRNQMAYKISCYGKKKLLLPRCRFIIRCPEYAWIQNNLDLCVILVATGAVVCGAPPWEILTLNPVARKVIRSPTRCVTISHSLSILSISPTLLNVKDSLSSIINTAFASNHDGQEHFITLYSNM